MLDEHTPKLTLKDTRTTDIDSAISINGFPNMVQNNLNCFTLQNCGLQTNNHCILPVQVKSCWKIYKGWKHRTLEDSGYRFVVIGNSNEELYKHMVVL